jgi:hypothetical protein
VHAGCASSEGVRGWPAGRGPTTPVLAAAPQPCLCAGGLVVPQRQRMLELFHQGCRLEYLFWDGAYRRQQWPL